MKTELLRTGETFRDPQGRLYRDGDRIFREIHPEHATGVLTWMRSPLAQRWMQEGRLVSTQIISSAPGEPVLLEHEPVFFPTYPWEWTPAQWRAAAILTLDLCGEALAAGYILKDATPLNVLFRGPKAVFVDVLSFERLDPGVTLWTAYGQFVRTFLLPLAAHAYLGWPLAASQQRRDGYEPRDLAPWLSTGERWFGPMRSLVTLPLLLEKKSLRTENSRFKLGRPDELAEMSAMVLRRTLRTARKLLDTLIRPPRQSRWSEYAHTAFHYAAEDHAAKRDFVVRCLESVAPARLLDVGANTGVYSRMAVEAGAQVVAWDPDVRATELNWQSAAEAGLPVLPLVADFARPTPASGWRNAENLSLLSRARGQFDCVLMLGLLHHLLIADQIPLEEIVQQLAETSARWAIVEWIPCSDIQFGELCRGRQDMYAHLTEEYFIGAMESHFALRDRTRLGNGRTLYRVEKR